MSAPTAYTCAADIHKKLRNKKQRRATISPEFMRTICGRSRIESSFIEKLNNEAKDFDFIVYGPVNGVYVVARTVANYFDDDPAFDEKDEND